MSFNVNNRDSREIYDTAARMIAKANSVKITDIDKNQLTQGYVETHANLTPNNSLIQFPIVDTQQVTNAPVTPLMRLLSMQDSFVVGSVSYFLMLYFFNGTQATPDYTRFNYFTPLTYPARFPNFWAPAAPDTAQQIFLDLGCSMFWNGYLSYEVDKKVIIPYWNCSRHYYAPPTQAQGLSSPSSGGFQNNMQFNTNEYDGSTDAFYPVEPTIVMGGGRQNIWKLNLPANIPGTIMPFRDLDPNSVYGVNFFLKACLRFHGILAQNSTSVK